MTSELHIDWLMVDETVSLNPNTSTEAILDFYQAIKTAMLAKEIKWWSQSVIWRMYEKATIQLILSGNNNVPNRTTEAI